MCVCSAEGFARWSLSTELSERGWCTLYTIVRLKEREKGIVSAYYKEREGGRDCRG